MSGSATESLTGYRRADGNLDWYVSSIRDCAVQCGFDTGIPFGSSGNRLYQNQGDGSFVDVTEYSATRIGSWGFGKFNSRAFDLGVVDDQQGRGIVCFDYDQDGDIDMFIANNEQSPRLERNDGGNAGNYLQI